GAAATEDGIISATSVMAYVHTKVATDRDSNQTPHFGHFDGDGDLIFQAPQLSEAPTDDERGIDIMISVPSLAERERVAEQSIADLAKSYVVDPLARIRLDDLVNQTIRKAIADLEAAKPSMAAPLDAESFAERLAWYRRCIRDLVELSMILA